jgi:hypothetical protein
VRDEQLITQRWRECAARFETGPEKVLTKIAHGSGRLYGPPVDQMADGRLLAIVSPTPSWPPWIRVVRGVRLGAPRRDALGIGGVRALRACAGCSLRLERSF